jgi:hypothetical protein
MVCQYIHIKPALSILLISLLLVSSCANAPDTAGRSEIRAQLVSQIISRGFDPEQQPSRPDYGEEYNWAALPGIQDQADLLPKDTPPTDRRGTASVDVFFVHPTGYFGAEPITSPIESSTAAEANRKWSMAYQASAFNGCCEVYAPKYRQATLLTYFLPVELRNTVLDFAYQDVLRAFEYFIKHYNQGRPFIIASHSQGSHHAKRLLAELVDSSDLHKRMVAAYVIGSSVLPVSSAWIRSLKNIGVCHDADDLGCIVHWDTFASGAAPAASQARSVCTNPLSWKTDGLLAPETLHKGAIRVTNEFYYGLGEAAHVAVAESNYSLGRPVSGALWAKCENGALLVKRQAEHGLKPVGPSMADVYHLLDYSLFYMNIRDNAIRRSDSFLE